MDRLTLTDEGRRFLDDRISDSKEAKPFYIEMRERFGCSAWDIRMAYANAAGQIDAARKELTDCYG